MALLASGAKSGKFDTKMQKSLTLFLFGFGLVLVSAGAAFAKTDILPVHFGSTTPLFNVNPGRPIPAGHTDHAAGGAFSLVAASHQAADTCATAAFKMSSAILAGALTLLLIQQKRRADNVLRLRR
jgi:hypothetical protein